MAGFKDRLIKFASGLNIKVYRASKGRIMGKAQGQLVGLLTVPGRKSGRPYTWPLVIFDEQGSWLVAGSAGGDPREPQWFRNLRAAETAKLEVRDRTLTVRVDVVSGEEHATLWPTVVARAPGFGKYRDKAGRDIPLARLTPVG